MAAALTVYVSVFMFPRLANVTGVALSVGVRLPSVPMRTGFGLFGTVGFGVVGVGHGGFLVRFVV